MSSRRFLLASPPEGSRASLEGEEAFHLARVLRCHPGDRVELIDGTGKIWQATVSAVSARKVDFTRVELLLDCPGSSLTLGLIQSLCKADKLEWILQKSTEIGISQIFLVNAARSTLKVPEDRLATKFDRWQKILRSAVKQSRRSTIPLLYPPEALDRVCKNVQADLKLLVSESERDTTLKKTLEETRSKSVVFCIGPEGGWTAGEQSLLQGCGFKSVSLGANILRTETAAIAVAAILRYELED